MSENQYDRDKQFEHNVEQIDNRNNDFEAEEFVLNDDAFVPETFHIQLPIKEKASRKSKKSSEKQKRQNNLPFQLKNLNKIRQILNKDLDCQRSLDKNPSLRKIVDSSATDKFQSSLEGKQSQNDVVKDSIFVCSQARSNNNNFRTFYYFLLASIFCDGVGLDDNQGELQEQGQSFDEEEEFFQNEQRDRDFFQGDNLRDNQFNTIKIIEELECEEDSQQRSKSSSEIAENNLKGEVLSRQKSSNYERSQTQRSHKSSSPHKNLIANDLEDLKLDLANLQSAVNVRTSREIEKASLFQRQLMKQYDSDRQKISSQRMDKLKQELLQEQLNPQSVKQSLELPKTTKSGIKLGWRRMRKLKKLMFSTRMNLQSIQQVPQFIQIAEIEGRQETFTHRLNNVQMKRIFSEFLNELLTESEIRYFQKQRKSKSSKSVSGSFSAGSSIQGHQNSIRSSNSQHRSISNSNSNQEGQYTNQNNHSPLELRSLVSHESQFQFLTNSKILEILSKYQKIDTILILFLRSILTLKYQVKQANNFNSFIRDETVYTCLCDAFGVKQFEILSQSLYNFLNGGCFMMKVRSQSEIIGTEIQNQNDESEINEINIEKSLRLEKQIVEQKIKSIQYQKLNQKLKQKLEEENFEIPQIKIDQNIENDFELKIPQERSNHHSKQSQNWNYILLFPRFYGLSNNGQEQIDLPFAYPTNFKSKQITAIENEQPFSTREQQLSLRGFLKSQKDISAHHKPRQQITSQQLRQKLLKMEIQQKRQASQDERQVKEVKEEPAIIESTLRSPERQISVNDHGSNDANLSPSPISSQRNDHQISVSVMNSASPHQQFQMKSDYSKESFPGQSQQSSQISLRQGKLPFQQHKHRVSFPSMFNDSSINDRTRPSSSAMDQVYKSISATPKSSTSKTFTVKGGGHQRTFDGSNFTRNSEDGTSSPFELVDQGNQGKALQNLNLKGNSAVPELEQQYTEREGQQSQPNTTRYKNYQNNHLYANPSQQKQVRTHRQKGHHKANTTTEVIPETRLENFNGSYSNEKPSSSSNQNQTNGRRSLQNLTRKQTMPVMMNDRFFTEEHHQNNVFHQQPIFHPSTLQKNQIPRNTNFFPYSYQISTAPNFNHNFPQISTKSLTPPAQNVFQGRSQDLTKNNSGSSLIPFKNEPRQNYHTQFYQTQINFNVPIFPHPNQTEHFRQNQNSVREIQTEKYLPEDNSKVHSIYQSPPPLSSPQSNAYIQSVVNTEPKGNYKTKTMINPREFELNLNTAKRIDYTSEDILKLLPIENRRKIQSIIEQSLKWEEERKQNNLLKYQRMMNKNYDNYYNTSSYSGLQFETPKKQWKTYQNPAKGQMNYTFGR